MTVSQAAVVHAGELLRAHIGLRVESSLRGRLTRAIGDAAWRAGQEPDTFVAGLACDPTSLQSLCDRVTVQESGFFRHPDHFEVLARHIVPAIKGSVRIWSAGCANGQEAYSLAMVLTEHGVDGRVMATDVSTAAVRRTKEAHYGDRELTGLDELRRRTHGSTAGGGWTVGAAVSHRVDVSVRNLLDPLPSEIAGYQVVFCRNVLIYFTPEHAADFIGRLADVLPAEAHLFLGGAESMLYVNERFEPRRFGDTFVYRLRSRAAATPAVSVTASRSAGSSGRRPSGAARPPSNGVPHRRAARMLRQAAAGAAPVTAADLARIGLEAHREGNNATAVRAFRQWAYLAPDDPLAHFHLGLAFEAGGHRAAAMRSFAVSRAALLRGDVTLSVEAFGGYGIDDVLRMIATKQAAFP